MTPANRRDNLACTLVNPEIAPWQGLIVEAWITFILVLTIHGSTNEKRKPSLFMPTIPIGFAVALGIMAGVWQISDFCKYPCINLSWVSYKSINIGI